VSVCAFCAALVVCCFDLIVCCKNRAAEALDLLTMHIRRKDIAYVLPLAIDAYFPPGCLMYCCRSTASAGEQVRGVGKQVGGLGVGSKMGCPRHERAIDRSTALTSKWEVPGVRRDRQVHSIGR
jgi:hypothetical protein